MNPIDLSERSLGAIDLSLRPTSHLTNEHLDSVYAGMSPDDAWGVINYPSPLPAYVLVVSPHASRTIKRERGIRDDVRTSASVDELLKSSGNDLSFRGFYHVLDENIPRFVEADGELIQVGSGQASYESAPYEMAYVVPKRSDQQGQCILFRRTPLT